jgi:hypothetical protein
MQERTRPPAATEAGATRPGHAAGARKPKRASKRRVRVWAWMAGSLSFLAPFAMFGVSPKPAQGQPVAAPTAARTRPHRPVVLVITKKIIYQRAAAPSVTTTSGGGGVNYVYAPASTPVAVSCGTHPC